MQRSDSSVRPIADKAAVGLSVLCALHCLLTPLAVALLPSLAGLGLEDERFHLWMVVIVLPVSALALAMGCRKHRNWSVLGLGVAGLLILIATVVAGHEMLGEVGERAFTLLGALLIAASHIRNFQLCQAPTCPDSTSA